MTKDDLVTRISDGIIHQEGYMLTPRAAASIGIKWPCFAQITCNIGNIRDWSKNGIKYPKTGGYVDFVRWAQGDIKVALTEANRVLRIQVENYIDGKLHGGVSPTLLQMFQKYAPSSDSNIPDEYAKNVAKIAGISIDKPLKGLIS